MADIDFPSGILREPLKAGFNRDTNYGLDATQPSVGTEYMIRTSRDKPKLYTLQFSFNGDMKQAFWSWLEYDLDGGILPFNIDLEDEFGVATKEAWFTPDGLPQLQSVRGGVYTYGATIRTKG